MICPLCKGKRYNEDPMISCKKCRGDGKVDWISNAMEVKKKGQYAIRVR